MNRCRSRARRATRVAKVLAGCGLAAASIVIGGAMIGCSDEERTAPDSNDLGRTVASFDDQAPNIVVVMTDDQAVDTMAAMPRTERLLGDTGTSFSNAVVSFPLCCPSRAAFLTGQYAHNNNVRDNGPPDGGIGALDQTETLPVWLRQAGYNTTFVGKYLNGYGKAENGGPEFIPPGWVNWYALTAGDKTSAYDYEVNENGKLVGYGTDEADYKTDVMSDLADAAIKDSVDRPRPFFLWVATSDPHTDNGLGPDARRNPLPAPRDLGSFKGAEPPQPKSFDEADVSDKPKWLQDLPRLSSEQLAEIRTLYVSQLESLGAVDDLVARLVSALRQAGELRNTLVVFTSDNGFIRGQHRIDSGKSLIYEEAIRVPLLMTGPGIPKGQRFGDVVANVDLSPTILRAADVKPGLNQDGLPLQPVLNSGHSRPPVLLEIFGRKDGDVFGVRTNDWVYAEHSDGFAELYNLSRDPLQLDNMAGQPSAAAEQGRLSRTLTTLRDCSGQNCR